MNNWSIRQEFAKRNVLLKAAGYRDYQEFINSPAWGIIQNLWAEERRKHNPRWDSCFCCGTDQFLTLHHLTYKYILKPVLGKALVPLCRRCHTEVHLLTRKNPLLSLKEATQKWKEKVEWRKKQTFAATKLYPQLPS